MTAPKSLIINSPYERPVRHWKDDRGTLKLIEERRSAGYEIFNIRNNTRRTESLTLVNAIRERVAAWRAAEYPGITSVTRGLLEQLVRPIHRGAPIPVLLLPDRGDRNPDLVAGGSGRSQAGNPFPR